MPTTPQSLAALIWKHPANRGHRIQAMQRALAWQAYKRTVRIPFTIRAYGDLRFRCYPDSVEPGRLLYFRGRPDYDEMTFMSRFLRQGDRVLDGGAHHGLYTLLAASLCGPSGHVDAVEATPLALHRLLELVELNALSSVSVHAAALVESPGPTAFALRGQGGAGNRLQTAEDAHVPTLVVQGRTIDELGDGQSYEFVKLDLEGAEVGALRGASGLLSNPRPPVIQIEAVPRFLARYATTLGDLQDLLRSHKYLLARFDAEADQLLLDVDVSEAAPDILAVPETAVPLVKGRLSDSELSHL